jgi:hypothetical protein
MVGSRARFTAVAIFLLGVAVGALSLTAVQRGTGAVVHAQSAGCTSGSLNGTYGVLGLGYVPTGAVGSSSGAPVQLAAVLVVTADGAGSLSIGGFMNPSPVPGSYSVNPDCSFTLTITGPTTLPGPNGTALSIDNPTAHVLGVLVDGGKRFYVTTADPNHAQYFIGERQ